MLTALMVLLRSIGLICGGHRAVVLENLALRQQLAVLTRTVKRPQLRSTDRLFWILLAKALAGLALRLDRRAARYRGPMAPPMAPPALDPALTTDGARAGPAPRVGHSRARRHDGRRESAVGRAADPRRIGQAGHHGLGADGVAAPAATASPAVTDVADLSDQSCRHAGVDGLLHRADPHRPRAVRAWSCSATTAGESSTSTSRNIPRRRGRRNR